MALEEYRRKRAFNNTPEPPGDLDTNATDNQWRFCVQKHDATRLHYDLRLELDGVLLSWAVPKGPSLDWEEKRLSIHVEDHPLEYLQFEGVIPAHEYGGGTVMVWDLGHWNPRGDAREDYEAGALKFDLHGEKLHGGYMLKRLDHRGENQWLLIKEKDESMRQTVDFDVLAELPDSVLTGRDLGEIAADRDAIWSTADGTGAWNFEPENYTKARKKVIPSLVRPCLPTASRNAPTGDKWVHEIKYDGYRMICHLDKGKVRFQSRNGKDWTNRLPSLARMMSGLPVDNAILDGEVVMMDENGVTSFQALQNRIGAGNDAELRYYVFDLLYANGHSLTALPMLERKEILESLISASPTSARLNISEHLDGDGPTIFRQACKLGVEGIVSKRIDRRYAEGRFEFWLKTKCLQSREFMVGGFTPPTASRKGLGAILLGVPVEDDRLHFVGKVGTGFTHATLVELRGQLDELRIPKSPFVNLNRKTADKGTMWVTPKLVAEIEFGGWTGDGVIRFGAFRGLRDDLNAEEIDATLPRMDVSNESSLPPSDAVMPDPSTHGVLAAAADVRVDPLLELPEELASVRLTSPDRVVYPDMGITKLGVATYYAQIGKYMLPHMVGRPVSLLRCPGGVADTCFFQKRAPKGLHESVERIELPTSEGMKLFLVVHDIVGLLSLVQFGVLEFHVSGSRADKFEKPDRLVFDLDPDEKLPFTEVAQAAREIRDWLAKAGLESFLKTTGGKGLHIVVPIRRRHPWEDMKKFTANVAAMFEGQAPRRFTTNSSKSARRNRILIDVMRNTRGATTVAAFSTRAKARATVSVPITWSELDIIARSDGMSLQAVIGRIAHQEEDPWESIDDIDQGITKQTWSLLG